MSDNGDDGVKFSVIMESRVVLKDNGEVMTKEGKEAWPYMSDGYETTSWYKEGYEEGYSIGHHIMMWPTSKGAEGYAKRMNGHGHPWYFVGNGKYRVVELVKRMKFAGYDIKE